MLGASRELTFPSGPIPRCRAPKNAAKKTLSVVDVLNLALPYFGLIFIGFACGKDKGLPESGLSWMNFFLLYVSLPALLFDIMSKTPFAELNNPPFSSERRRADGAILARADTWIEPASVAVLIGTFASMVTLTSVMWLIQSGRLAFP